MKYYFIDLFCGAGGVTTGVHRAQYNGQNIAQVIACVNHDPTAISSHAANHPDVLHYTEDIRTLDLTDLQSLVQLTRIQDPDAVICLWASLECTNFSKAKGGMPRDADSRTLAEHLFRYIDDLNPDMIWIENVEEFMSWGPLDKNGKPVSKRAGTDYIRWTNMVQQYGYQYDWRILNAADFGAYTSRKRLFIQFAKGDIEITWPQATHGKTGHNDAFSSLKKHKAVREVLNLSDTGESIFIPGRIKSDKTMERIYHGLIKFVAGGKKEFESFLLKFNSTGADGNVKHSTVTINAPAPTIDTQNRLRIINPIFISKYYSGAPEHKNISLDGPAGTIKTADGQVIVQAEFVEHFITKYHSGKSAAKRNRNYSLDELLNTVDTQNRHYLISYHHSDKAASIDKPLPTLTTKDKKAFISAYYGNGHNCTGVDQPSPTVTGGDRFVLVSPHFIYRQFSSETNQSIDKPSGSVSSNPKLNLITAEQFLMDTQFGNGARDINEPAPTQTSSRHHYYLMNPQWFDNKGSSVDQPCFTLIARQDKTPAYLICAQTGACAIEVTEQDLPHAILIKAFMALYGIADVKMRMLDIAELLRIQGFGDDYKLLGSKTKQKWMLGNAVECTQAQVLIEASFSSNFYNKKQVA